MTDAFYESEESKLILMRKKSCEKICRDCEWFVDIVCENPGPYDASLHDYEGCADCLGFKPRPEADRDG